MGVSAVVRVTNMRARDLILSAETNHTVSANSQLAILRIIQKPRSLLARSHVLVSIQGGRRPRDTAR
jgi:hypothetical protein